MVLYFIDAVHPAYKDVFLAKSYEGCSLMDPNTQTHTQTHTYLDIYTKAYACVR
jgi:hypothetical protein